MSNVVVRTIVENIMNDKFDTLKEDLSKAVSAKAVNVLESKKAMVGKNFFGNKQKMNEEMTPSNLSTRTKRSLVSALHDHQKNGYDELSPHLENAWKGRKAEAGSHPAFDKLHPEVQNHLVKAYHTFAKDAGDADGIDDFDHEGIANHLDSAVEAHNKKMNEEKVVTEAWYTTKPHAKGHQIVSVNNKQNPYKHKVGDIVSKGEHTQRQYSSDGSAYSEK